MQAELEKLRAENEALKQSNKRTGAISMKVSERGAVSVYGLGRFPPQLTLISLDQLKSQVSTQNGRLANITSLIADANKRIANGASQIDSKGGAYTRTKSAFLNN